MTTFKRPSFLDYVYFTQLETSDPVSYGYPNPSPELTGAYSQCELTYEQGRYNNPIPNSGGEYCNKISFVTGDQVKGPMHTNDTIAVCGSPVFGNEASDAVEMGGKSPGWFSTCSGSSPVFIGTRVTSAPILVPPETNSKLKTIAEKEELKSRARCGSASSGTTMTVGTGSDLHWTVLRLDSAQWGDLRRKLEWLLQRLLALHRDLPLTSPCGNVYVHGTYTGQLTIAAENDIVVDGNLCRASCAAPSGTGLLGLIANNFVRVYHAYTAGEYRSGEEAEGRLWQKRNRNGPQQHKHRRRDPGDQALVHRRSLQLRQSPGQSEP